jgi:hypothetical protein
MAAQLTRSDSEGLCTVYPKQWMRTTIYCRTAMKRIRMLEVSVRTIKALPAKMERVTLISKGREKLKSFVYYVSELIVKYFAEQVS